MAIMLFLKYLKQEFVKTRKWPYLGTWLNITNKVRLLWSFELYKFKKAKCLVFYDF